MNTFFNINLSKIAHQICYKKKLQKIQEKNPLLLQANSPQPNGPKNLSLNYLIFLKNKKNRRTFFFKCLLICHSL